MVPRSSDIARSLLERIEQLEAENAELRAQVTTLEQEAAILAGRLTRARAERRRALAPPLSLPRVRSA
jgi:cell division protein FtsB